MPIVFFQNQDDRDLFLGRKLVRADQARLLPGSGIDLARFTAAEMPSADAPPVFLMIARLLRDKGVIEFVEAARLIKARYPEARFQLLGATGSENRSAIDNATVEAWVAEGVVEYLGTTNDVRPAIAAACSFWRANAGEAVVRYASLLTEKRSGTVLTVPSLAFTGPFGPVKDLIR